MNKHKKRIFITILSILCFECHGFAQAGSKDWEKKVLEKDSSFWVAFNTCNTADYGKFLTEDVEFYHDAGGLTVGLDNLMSSTKKNLCSGAIKLRRASIKDTYKTYPLKNGDVIYGAILSGEHLFFKEEKGQKEKPEGIAKFTHLWIFKDGDWKMSRVLSYDHGPAPANIK